MQFADNAGPDKAYQGLHCPLTESMDIVVYMYVDEQRMSISDCTDANAHLDLRWSITKTRLFKYTENFTSKKGKLFR